jgi:hypothetical protein
MESHQAAEPFADWAAPARRPGSAGGRPLELLVLGGAVALATLLAVLVIVYKAWYAQEMAENTATLICGFLFFVYTGGVYIFCYGWERADVGKAVRLTVVVVLLTAVAVLIVALVLAVLSKSKGAVSKASETADGEGENVIDLGLLRVVGSYVEDGSVDLDRARQEPETQSDLFTITCWQCNQDFIPLPPNAACPNCGWTAVTVA